MEPSPASSPFEQPAASRYVLGHQIAKGGMGSILEAWDAYLSRSVAVKRMLTENEMESDRSRFQREALVLARLAHPNIVPIHDFGQDENGTPFYAMKLVRGQTLEAILRALREPKSTKEKSPYTLERLLTIFQKICDAMAFAHRQGIIHRDLKPDNIMVGEFGEVQVMDWGLAKDLHGTLPAVSSEPRNSSLGADLVLGDTLSGDIMGSPQYMAPEQAEGRVADQDETTDVFLLGGILYAILTLRPPLQGSNFKELLNKAITADIVSPTRLTTMRTGPKAAAAQSPALRNTDRFTHCPGGRIPPALSAVAMKALSGRKKNHYASVSDLAADVEAYQNGFATRAENASAFRLISLFVSRHRAFATSLVLVLAVGGILGTKAFIEGVRAEKALTELRQTAPALRELAESEATFQRFDSALAKLDAALALAPEDPEGWWQRAWLLVGMEKWAEAAAALRVAAEKDTSHPERTAILPTLEGLAADPEDRRWTKERIDSLVPFLDGTPNTVPARLALAYKLKLAAEPRCRLVADRLEKWLGKGQGSRAVVVARSRVRVNLDKLGLADLEPLRGLPIDELQVSELRRQLDLTTSDRITSLEPLRGMRLSYLNIDGSEVTDLSPLAGMPLEYLNINWCKVSDLSPLRGAPIRWIYAVGIQASDFTPLRGAPIVEANLNDCPFLTNVDFLAESRVEKLDVARTPVTNLSALRGKSLRSLAINAALELRDLESLRGSLVREINMDFTRISDFTPLLDLPNLERIRSGAPWYQVLPLFRHPTLKYIAQGQFGPMRPTSEVWKEFEEQAKASGTTLDGYIANLNLLQERIRPFETPGASRISFQGAGLPELGVHLEGLSLQDLEFLRGLRFDHLTLHAPGLDLAPLKDLSLRKLGINASGLGGWSFSDVSRLTELHIDSNRFKDLDFLRAAPIERLFAGTNEISDLAPLKGKPLKILHIQSNRVSDLRPLAGRPITELIVLNNPLSSIEPIMELKSLERLIISGPPEKLAPLRRHSSLKAISLRLPPEYVTVDKFWKELDAKASPSKPSPAN